MIDAAAETTIAQLAKSLPVRFDGGVFIWAMKDVTDAIPPEGRA